MESKADRRASPIEQLMAFVQKELSKREIAGFLRKEGFAKLAHFDSGMNAFTLLYQYLLENDPFEFSKRHIPQHTLENIERDTGDTNIESLVDELFNRLGIPRLKTYKFHYSLDNLNAVLKNAEDEVKDNPKALISIKGLLQEAGTILEKILLLTLIFYKRVFTTTPIVCDILSKEKIKAPRIYLTLGSVLYEIENIEKLFKENVKLQEWAWLRFQRLSPFQDLPFDLLRQFKNDHRDLYSHQSISPLIERDNDFIRDALRTLRSTIGEIEEKNIVPITIIISYKGVDVYGRHIWGFWDEWTLRKKDIYSLRVKM